MSHTKVDYTDTESTADAMHFLREPLDAEQLGFTVVDCDPGWTGKEHDHAEMGHEEVYFLVSGSATLTVDGEDVSLSPGDAVRVAPESVRHIHNGDEHSRLVIAGAP
jgi:quercetin dioxygenase-like cupin family protein